MQGVVAEDEGDVTRHALALVDGHGVTVGEVPGGDVLARHVEGGAAAGLDLDFTVRPADDDAMGAVDEADSSVVAEGKDMVADPQLEVIDGEDGRAEVAVREELGSGAVVEVSDVVAVPARA